MSSIYYIFSELNTTLSLHHTIIRFSLCAFPNYYQFGNTTHSVLMPKVTGGLYMRTKECHITYICRRGFVKRRLFKND